MLLFAVAVQAALERADGAADGVTIVAVADDVAIAGRVEPLHTAFECLAGDEGVRAAGLCLRPRKCILAAGRAPECAAAGAALAAEPGVRRRPEGAKFAGTPFGADAHVESVVGARATDTVERWTSFSVCPSTSNPVYSFCACCSRGACSICNCNAAYRGRASRQPRAA